MKRFLISFSLTLACLGAAAPAALACPMCKYANEADQKKEDFNRRPQAYMYSILFMLAMPATIFTAFGVSFYRMSRGEVSSEFEHSDLPNAGG